MQCPADTPVWLLKLIGETEMRVESSLLAAKTADETLKASGAFGLWIALKEEIGLLAQKEQIEIRERNRSLNARTLAG